MGDIKPTRPVKMFCGMIAADEDVIVQARSRLSLLYGEIDLESDAIPFDFTDYYKEEMGTGLVRKFLSFRDLIDPSRLAEIKIRSNALEQELATASGSRRCRRINLDPGYVEAGKLVLATTKNVPHRICIGQGIYAEVTLMFGKKGFTYFDWTYLDYRSGRYDPFFLEVRRRYMNGDRQEGKAQ